jgi:hypothetical protein
VFQTGDALRHSDNNLATNKFNYFNRLKTWMAERLLNPVDHFPHATKHTIQIFIPHFGKMIIVAI